MKKRLIMKVLFTLFFASVMAGGSVETVEAAETTAVESESQKELSPEERIEILLQAGDNKASGIVDEEYGQIKWVIDANWHLLVVGTGEISDSPWDSRAPWFQDSYNLKSAEFHLDNITDLSYLLRAPYVENVDLSGIDSSQTTTMKGMLDDCYNLKTVNLSGLDTGKVEDMSEMFEQCGELLEVDLSGFDTSKVKDMSRMFNMCQKLKKLNLTGLDTSSVTNMESVFCQCNSLEELDVSHFDTSKVTTMRGMFAYCETLNELDVRNFDISKVTDVYAMFAGCKSLKELDVSNFDLSNVKETERFIGGCSSLRSIYSPINCSAEIELPVLTEADYWLQQDGTKIKYMPQGISESVYLERVHKIAAGTVDEDYGKIQWEIDEDGKLTVTGTGDVKPCPGYDLPWSDYCEEIKSVEVNVAGMTDATFLFYECRNMTEADLSGLDTSQITNMEQMFCRCSSLESLDLSGFDTSNVTSMCSMFNECSSLKELNIEGFETGNVTDMRGMFAGCAALESLDVSGFDTRKVTLMNSMFFGCESLTSLDVSGFVTDNVTTMNDMFYGCASLETLDVTNFNTGKVTKIYQMFFRCKNLKELDVSSFDTSKIEEMWSLFEGCSSLEKLNLGKFSTVSVTDMENLFAGCSSLESLDVSSFDTSKVEKMQGMFKNCSSLKTLDLSNFSTGKRPNVTSMFEGCSALEELNVSSFRNLGTTACMFKGCASLKELDIRLFNMGLNTAMFEGCESLEELDFSYFDGVCTEDISSLFKNCKSLKTLDISSFKVGNLKNAASMFEGCSSLEEIKLCSFYSDDIENISYMFAGCESLKSLEGLYINTVDTTDMSHMFENCKSLKTLDLSRFLTNSLMKINRMFAGCSSLEEIKMFRDTYLLNDLSGLFENCGALTKLDLSGLGVYSYGGYGEVPNTTDVFAGCHNLNELVIPKNCLQDIYLPKAAEDDCWYLFDGTTTDIIPKELAYSMTIMKNRYPDAPVVSNVFCDVYEGEWYGTYIQYVFENQLMKGEANTNRFTPNHNITKAQVAQVLYNMEGCPEVTDFNACNLLQDVYYGEWYDDAVCWAYNHGIITGDLNEKKFYPNSSVTREQLALMLYRYAAYKGEQVSVEGNLEGLKNAENVSNWAEPAVNWAVGSGLISGIEIHKNGEVIAYDLAPQGTATRAQMAAILMRFCEKTNEVEGK